MLPLILAALLSVTTPIATARAEGQPAAVPADQEWFVQVTMGPGLPATVEDGDDPGRVEVSISGRFVACQTAAYYKNGWDQIVLVPTALGATARGRREDITVRAYGELGRVATPVVKVTPVVPGAAQ